MPKAKKALDERVLTPKKMSALFIAPPNQHGIKISRHPTDSIFLVQTADQVKNGDVLTWEAIGTDVTITFPRIGGAKVVDPESINIQEGNKGSMRVILVDHAGTKGFYKNNYKPEKEDFDIEVPYSVYCVKTNSYAGGSSDPKIIVKGP